MPEAWDYAIVNFLAEVFQAIGWPGVAAIMVLDSLNVPIPSEVPMPLAGWLLVQQQGGTALQAILLGGFWGSLGSTFGAVVSYGLGYWGGRAFLERFGKYARIGADDLARADAWVARWGDAAAFLSRMIPLVRTFISFPLGMAKARFGSFVFYTWLGSFIWSAALSYVGFLWGENWVQIREAMRPFDKPILLALGGLTLFVAARHVWRAYGRSNEAGKAINPTSDTPASMDNPSTPK